MSASMTQNQNYRIQMKQQNFSGQTPQKPSQNEDVEELPNDLDYENEEI
jgi:hypothetical protein